EGLGLGDRFLRHVERTKVLVHLVDVSGASGRDPVDDFDVIQRELRLFNAALAVKPQLVAANKIDALDDPARLEALAAHVEGQGLPFFRISGVTGDGVPGLLEAAWAAVAAARETAAEVPDVEEDTSPDLISPARTRQDT